uniref:Uncharacterized protein n=1 Tax=Parascaris equorum TaxID=6256 RepID=A0A914SB31_PAREQ
EKYFSITAAELPWGSLKFVPISNIDYTVLPSQFAVKSLLGDLFGLFDRKLQSVLDDEHPVRLLAELKKETPVTPATVNNIIALLMAMKFFRVKVPLF